MTPDYNYPYIETSRLVLKPLNKDNIQDVFKHFSDPHITEFMDIEPCKNNKEAEEIIQFHEDDLGCRWGIYLKSTNQFIGTGGYHCLELDTNPKVEIGFDLAKEFWGKGLMKEAIITLHQFAFQTMRLQYIEATVEQSNIRSQKLLEKLYYKKSDNLVDNLFYYTLQSEDYRKYLEEASNYV